MEFHRIPAEKLRDQIFKIIIDKDLVKEGLTFDDLKLHIPFDDNDNIVPESDSDESVDPVVKTEIFSDNIQDDTANNQVQENPSDENTDSKKEKKPKKEKKEKKEKKPKKEKSDKPSKPAPSFAYFKSHPDNQEVIDEASKEINEETGKPFGKVKGAGIVWQKLYDEDKEHWKQRSIDDFNSKQTVNEESTD